MRRLAVPLALLALLATGCGNPLGRSVPECDVGISGTMVLQVQSVPGSPYVSCIDGLKAGWTYEHLQAQSGRSVYWLDSDRMGEPFVTVESVVSCDPGTAVAVGEPRDGVTLFRDVAESTTVEIVVVPEGPTSATLIRGLEIRGELAGTEIKGRHVNVAMSDARTRTENRIRQAAAAGAHVIVVGVRDFEEKTVTLLLAGQSEEIEEENLRGAVDEIEDVTGAPSYLGKWYYVFDGGCVIYTFNARGSGVTTIEEDIEQALGLFDAEDLREEARELGYDI